MNPDLPNDPRAKKEAKLTALLLGELSDAEAAALRAELANDPELARLHDELRRTLPLVRETVATPADATAAPPAPLKLSDERRAKLLAQFKTVPFKQPAPRKLRDLSWLVPLGAAAAVTLIVGSLFLPTIAKPKSKAQRAQLPALGEDFSTVTESGAKPADAGATWGGMLFVQQPAPPPATPLPKLEIVLPRGGKSDEQLALTGGFGGGTDRFASSLREERESRPQLLGVVAGNNFRFGGVAPQSAKPSAEQRGADGRDWYYSSAPTPFFESGNVGQRDVARGGDMAATVPDVVKPVTLPSRSVRSEQAHDLVIEYGNPSTESISAYAILDPSDNRQSGAIPGGGTTMATNAVTTLEKSGGGTLHLNGVNTFSGGITLNGGTLAANSGPLMTRNGSSIATDFSKNQIVSANPTFGGKVIGAADGPAPKNQTFDSALRAPQVISEPVGFYRIPVLTNSSATAQITTLGGAMGAGSFGVNSPVDATGKSVADLVGSYKVELGKDFIAANPSGTTPESKFVGEGKPAAAPVPRVMLADSFTDLGGQRGLSRDTDADGVTRLHITDGTKRMDDERKAAGISTGEVVAGVPVRSYAFRQSEEEFMQKRQPKQELEQLRGNVAANQESSGGMAAVTDMQAGQGLALDAGRKSSGDGRWDQAEGQVKQAVKTELTSVAAQNQLGFGTIAADTESARRRLAVSKEALVEAEKAWTSGSKREQNALGVKSASDRAPEMDARLGRILTEADKEKNAAKEPMLRLAEVDLLGRESIKENLASLDDRIAKAKQSEDAPASKAKPTQAPIPQPEVLARENAFSTFSLNVSDVSFKLAAASLEQGQMPEVASVRSEEFINAFDYRDPEAAAGVPVAFAWERARYPFAHNRDLLRFSLKTAAVGRQAGRALNLVLVVDNSGSMERADRVRILREAMRVLAGELRAEDKFSVITFARTPRLVADGLSGSRAGEITKQLEGITPEGGTNIEEALNLAYTTARRHYVTGALNRVVLVTDGAANLGIVDPDALKARVEAYRKQGIALDCFGIGWEGFNDDLLEVLSRNGDGRYGFINTPEEAADEFAGQLAGALKVAASDVKVQVEFNPRRVTSWRQIGYAKHQLTKEQFRDNTVDAAEIAAQEAGNALYTVEVNPNGTGPIATVRIRFKIPATADYREHEWMVPFSGNAPALEQASPAMRLAATASAFSEWLVRSPFAGEVTPDSLLTYLGGVPEVYGADARPKKLEWMIRQAKSVSGK